MKEIELCFLNSNKELQELLRTELFLSRAQIKKYLTKKQQTFIPKKEQAIGLPMELVNNGLIYPEYTGEEIPIIYEDDLLLVFNKPSHIHGHPLNYSETNTVLNFARSRLNSCFLGKFSSNQERGLLYRLDEVTSGVLIYIKDEKIHSLIRESFDKAVKEKVYIAIVQGKTPEKNTLKHYFSSIGEKGKKRELSNEKGEELGELSYERISYCANEDLSCVRVFLKEGLRHQIRAQLAFVGHPILGDTLYGGKEHERIFLHALKYSFEFLGKTYSFSATSAELFDNFLDLNTCV